MNTTERRPLNAIAREIARNWVPMNYAARPYVDAMGSLDKITDKFYADAAEWPGLHAVGMLAKRRGIEYVLFDCDAGTVDGLQTYQW